MRIAQKIAAVTIAAGIATGFAPTVQAQEHEHELPPVCEADQVLPGFGFLPITFSRFIVALLGGDPEECQTPVE